jgi:hypothetical protein
MKYTIWDKVSDVRVPVGIKYTAEQWKERYPIAKDDDVDIVCGGGVINGSVFAVYEAFVEQKAEEGCNFEGCETKQDYLDRIEEFEKEEKNKTFITDNTRIADALEDLVVLNMPDEEE